MQLVVCKVMCLVMYKALLLSFGLAVRF